MLSRLKYYSFLLQSNMTHYCERVILIACSIPDWVRDKVAWEAKSRFLLMDNERYSILRSIMQTDCEKSTIQAQCAAKAFCVRKIIYSVTCWIQLRPNRIEKLLYITTTMKLFHLLKNLNALETLRTLVPKILSFVNLCPMNSLRSIILPQCIVRRMDSLRL